MKGKLESNVNAISAETKMNLHCLGYNCFLAHYS